MKRWFRSFDLHTRSFTNSFVCNFLSSSAGINLCRCFSRLALVFRLSLGFHFHGLLPLPLLFLTSAVFAFFRPLQFWILTTQPLFLPFPLLPNSASQWLPQCSALPFVPAVFPVLSCLVSRAFLPGSGTQPRCMFPFTLPRFAPTAVPRVLAFFSAFASLPAFSVPLPLPFVRFRFPSGYSALLFFLSLLPVSASQRLPQCFGSSFRLPRFPPSLPSGFPYFFSGFWYSTFCWFPFVLP